MNPYEAEAGTKINCQTCRRVFVKTIGLGEPAVFHRFRRTADGSRHCDCTLCDTCLALEALRA